MKKNNRLGEIKYQKCGLDAQIIEYENANHITVKFTNGELKKTDYKAFQNGVLSPDSNTRPNRLGEKHLMKNGLWAEIIEYADTYVPCKIKFEDGYISECLYANFKKGIAKHPNHTANKKHLNALTNIGLRVIQTDEEEAELVEYIDSCHVVIKYLSDQSKKTVEFSKFKQGRCPKDRIKARKIATRNKHLGRTFQSFCGMPYTIIDYKDKKDVDIQFYDGVIVKVTTGISNVLNGHVKHPIIDPLKSYTYMNYFIKGRFAFKDDENTYYTCTDLTTGIDDILTPIQMYESRL